MLVFKPACRHVYLGGLYLNTVGTNIAFTWLITVHWRPVCCDVPDDFADCKVTGLTLDRCALLIARKTKFIRINFGFFN